MGHPPRTSASVRGLHPHSHREVSLLQYSIEGFGLLAMCQAVFAQFTCIGIDARNLLEARMIVTPYNQHVRLLSSEPFGWFAPPKSTRAWEPTLLWNHYTQNPASGSPRPFLDDHFSHQPVGFRRRDLYL